MGIELLDHVIVSRESYFSFLENKMLKNGKEKDSDVNEDTFEIEKDETINEENDLPEWAEYYAAAELEKY